jgi:hypothetical protein
MRRKYFIAGLTTVALLTGCSATEEDTIVSTDEYDVGTNSSITTSEPTDEEIQEMIENGEIIQADLDEAENEDLDAEREYASSLSGTNATKYIAKLSKIFKISGDSTVRDGVNAYSYGNDIMTIWIESEQETDEICYLSVDADVSDISVESKILNSFKDLGYTEMTDAAITDYINLESGGILIGDAVFYKVPNDLTTTYTIRLLGYGENLD